jgi:hypothetical protein
MTLRVLSAWAGGGVFGPWRRSRLLDCKRSWLIRRRRRRRRLFSGGGVGSGGSSVMMASTGCCETKPWVHGIASSL